MKRASHGELWSLDLLDLRAFCVVVDRGSFTKAARVLGETKGSVSRRLSRLEDTLGCVLVQRSPRLVSPTAEGLSFRSRVGRALELIDDAGAELHDAKGAAQGHLRVTAPTDIALGVMVPHFASFATKYPNVQLDLMMTESILDFETHQIDVALRGTGGHLPDSTLIAHRLQEVEAGFYASPEYLSAHSLITEIANLADHRLLLPSTLQNTGTVAIKHRDTDESHTLPFRSALGASDFSFLHQMALAHVGIAVLGTNLACDEVKVGRLIRVLSDYYVFRGALYLMHRGSRFLAPKVRAFRDHILSAFNVQKKLSQ